MRSVIDVTDLSREEIQSLLDTALDIARNPAKYQHACDGKKLATLFYEPSTRTRLSFTAAMMELGGNVLGFSDPKASSTSKGETVADTAKVVSCYADIIAMRHPVEGAPLDAALHASVPLINAGDGSHCHPTQTLADLLTIYRRRGSFDHMTIGFCGDLRYGRTAHSLLGALSRYQDVKAVLISPEELRLPDFVKETILVKNGMTYEEVTSLEDAIPSLDMLYMTRIQQERFDSKEDYERLKDSYVLDAGKMKKAKKDCAVLHPLPRVNEIHPDVDDDPRAAYFEQVLNGKYMRMALILFLLEDARKNPVRENRFIGRTVIQNGTLCRNPRCISNNDRYVHHDYYVTDEKQKACRCVYCDEENSY